MYRLAQTVLRKSDSI